MRRISASPWARAFRTTTVKDPDYAKVARTRLAAARSGELPRGRFFRVVMAELYWMARGRPRFVPLFLGGVLIVLGLISLSLSYAVARGWWQGTSQALGVGFVIGGVVDVLAITGVDRISRADDRRAQQFNDSLRHLLAVPDKGDDEEARRERAKAIAEFL